MATVSTFTPQTTSLPVRHLFTLTGYPSESVKVAQGPKGNRSVFAPTGPFKGKRLSGKMVAPSAGWSHGPLEDILHLDAKLTLETDDDAGLICEYYGVIVVAENKIRAAPRFQTSDPRYARLNGIQAAAVGTIKSTDLFVLEYEVYELL